ncbi:hypothetical protein G3I25_36065, partial [Streptomyces rochei]|nr:hypothetical protein [Streptomyces rochei]
EATGAHADRAPGTASETRRAREPYDTPDTQYPHHPYDPHDDNEESDVLRRAFMMSGATVAAASLGP